jgi:hypothetical protein
MTTDLNNTYRALRLLRWYPSAWRERYGEEFVDFMEQELADTPHSFRRTRNIVFKGLIARLGAIGLGNPAIELASPGLIGVATGFVLSALFIPFALHHWSDAMLQWNQDPHWTASLPISVLLGVATVSMAVVLLLVVIGFMSLIVAALRRVIRRDAKGVTMPLTLTLASSIFIGLVVHFSLANVIARGGIQWTNPGVAIKQLAGAALSVTDDRSWVVNGPIPQFRDVAVLAPLAFVTLVLSVAVLMRRIGVSTLGNRVSGLAMTIVASSMGLFLVSYVGWIAAGGPDRGRSVLGQQSVLTMVVQCLLMAAMATLTLNARSRLGRVHLGADSSSGPACSNSGFPNC